MSWLRTRQILNNVMKHKQPIIKQEINKELLNKILLALPKITFTIDENSSFAAKGLECFLLCRIEII